MENQEFKEDESQIESDDDIGSPDSASFSTAVLSGNDWTTETIITQIDKGNIQLNPEFQRRDAWDKSRKSKFIESLIMGLPVPQIVLAESKTRRGSYIVLDGKQRLLSIRQFAADESDTVFNSFVLSGLEIRPDLTGLNLKSLKADLGHFDDLSAFENQPIRTVVIKNWPNEQFLFHIFLRLNTGSVPLSPQELRQALHPGPFVSFLDNESTQSNCLKEILKLSKPDFRMRDAELLLRYFGFKNFLHSYTGSLKDFLDNTCKRLNDDWSNSRHTIEDQLMSLEESHISAKTIFGDRPYRKWTGNEYESRFNRAIFDIMSLAFSDPSVRSALVGKERLLEQSFKNLCFENSDFRTSIETTTKSMWSTCTRISLWFTEINEVLGTNLRVPTLESNRIE